MAKPWSAWGTVLRAGLVAGVLDIADAFVVSGLRGVAPGRVLRHIASGVMGPGAAQGGVPAVLLGLLLHFVIATGAAATYFLASRRISLLRQRPILCGLFFGLCVWATMQYLILPLSLVRRGPGPQIGWPLVNMLGIHMLGVGLPIALLTRRYQSQQTIQETRSSAHHIASTDRL